MGVRKRRSIPFIRQRDMSECGTTCLAMLFKYYGLYNVQSSLRKLGNVTTEGTDLYTLSEIAQRFGFTSDGYQLGFDTLKEVPLPCIAHYEGNHFIVVYKVTKDHVWIVDPGYGRDRLTREQFEAKWNGVVLTLEPTAEVFKNPDVEELVAAQRSREKHVLRHFYLSLVSPFKRVIGEVLAASMMLQLLALALPFFTQVIIDSVLVNRNRQLLFAILAGMVVILVTQIALTYVRNLLITQFKVRFELDFFGRFFDHFIRLEQAYFDTYRREDFINRFQENLKIRNILSPSILQAFIDFLFVLLALAVLFLYDVRLALVALAFVLFFVVMTILQTPKLRRLDDKIFHENLQTMGSFLDTLLGMTSVKLLAIERFKFWQWKNRYKKALNRVLAAEQQQITLQSVLRGAFFVSQIAVYWIGAYMTFEGSMTIGEYIAFVTIFTAVMVSVNNVAGLWFMATELSVTFTRLNDVFLQEPERADLLAQHTAIDRPTVTFEGVSFAYPGSPDRPVLRDIDLVLRPGEHVAVVGRNGSGKTTLVKLLVKLYTNYEGRIRLDGTELRQIHPQVLRRKVVMVPQEPYVFAGTIMENIRYGNPSASPDDVVRAAKMADLHDFVKDLLFGYNYVVGEGGSNLSGGQKLKIVLARLFLADFDVLILDEASSVLDIQAEQRILHNLKTHFRDKTIVSIAHRIHTVRDADRILVLDGGRIVEEGTHDVLVLQEGLYHQFMQSYLGL